MNNRGSLHTQVSPKEASGLAVSRNKAIPPDISTLNSPSSEKKLLASSKQQIPISC